MDLLIVVLIILLAIVGTGATLVVRSRGRRPELEPPPRPPLAAEPRGDAGAGTPTSPVGVVDDELAGTPGVDLAAAPVAEPTTEPDVEVEIEVDVETEVDVEPPAQTLVLGERPSFRSRVGKTRQLLSGYLTAIRRRDRIDQETWDDLEEALIRADVGVETATELLDELKARVRTEAIADSDQLLGALKEGIVARLGGARELSFEPGAPNVWLFVGVNGVGKTTTIGKVGLRELSNGRSVTMAAGDTFRAAAADQLQLWADRVGADLVRGKEGGDPAAVIFDAVERAAARQIDLVLADTAGRLHNKTNLMEELRKVRRIAERPPGRLTEVLLVLDAVTGQNGLVQAKEFAATVGVTGIVLTKLDGTAKGGIALAIQNDLGIPIKLVGLGEGPSDLVDFDPAAFVDALFEA
jgi:fused signal recognition particle receptor